MALLLLAGTAAALLAGEPWAEKPAAEWTQEEALAVLGASPWGQEVKLWQTSGRRMAVFRDGLREFRVVYQESPQVAPRLFAPEPDRIEPELLEARYQVRWSSAGVVQQALKRLEELAPVLEEMQAPPDELSEEHYVLTARVVEPPTASKMEALGRPRVVDESGQTVEDRPAVVSDIFAGLSPEELREQAELRTAGKLHLKPDRVLRHGMGTSEGVSFFFPRRQEGRATLPAETDWVEFIFTSQKNEPLKARFRPAAMQINGRPDY